MTRRKKSPQPPNRDAWSEEFSRTLAEQRQRVKEFLAAQRERLGRIEAALAAAIQPQREEAPRPPGTGGANLAPRSASGPAARPATEGGLNWEAEKRRILAALETEDQGQDSNAAAARRAKIQQIVRTTDQALAEKDHEIEQIKHVLREQSNNLQGVAVGAAALDAVLDQDPLIREQRANLQQLEEHWQEMLRKAEIELSLERARLARERVAIEEKIRAHETQLAAQANLPAGVSAAAAKPVRGRWLARLGLKDGNTE
jgi:hypothetical protein